MDNMIKNALKYTIGIVAFLTALALYFFFMMSKNLSHQDQSTNAATVDVASETPRAQEQLQCDTDSNENALSSLKQDLNIARDDYSACSASLNQTERNISRLQSQLETLRSSSQDDSSELQAQLQSELQSAKESVDTLQAQMLTLEEEKQALEEEKQQLISASNSGDTEDEKLAKVQSDLADKNNENRKLSSSIKSLERKLADTEERLQQSQELAAAKSQLESELATLNQEKIGLLAKITELEAEDENSSSGVSGPLAIEKFETLPVLCDQHRSATQICVSSFEMVTKFNFRPNGFISLRLVGPDGDTIERDSIAAQEVNLYSFTFDDEILDAGEYTIELKIDDVFNQFNSAQTFSLSLPADLINKLNSGQ
ncbi:MULTISPECIES: hypothetical protein [Alteromonadaceae]|uniref:Chromosome segregation protein SMC n=1 Tax=Brumicola blandensis TaxID=3075611 RepID=A0AAW8R360_9ALTE|nr:MULTISPECIES: hypothetical protein [unclassified Alteromonas]MDT0582772.1 hypothetical protein [Alteromonas sp. W409]MDT0628188.1 hypothetical protein [Alteromonas sp. W364]